MKPISGLLSLHKTFDKTKETKGDPIYYVGTPEGIKKLSGTKLDKFVAGLTPETTIRITNTSTNVPLIQTIQKTGVKLETAHWHNTGLAKGLDAEAIAAAFITLPADIFTPVVIREDLYRLRMMVAARYAEVDFRRAWQLKQSAIKRSLGLGDKDPLPDFLQGQEDSIKQAQKEIEHPLEKQIAALAKTIPECQIMQDVLCVEGAWMTSASVVAYLGEPSRFRCVAAMWHYCGQHVVDGKAPKRATGSAVDWNPKIRTALWSWADSMLKTRNPRWRPVYDEYRATELEVHEQKCPKCAELKCATPSQEEKKQQIIKSHSGARARRRVVKDVLKEFFLLCNAGESDSQLLCETHRCSAVA